MMVLAIQAAHVAAKTGGKDWEGKPIKSIDSVKNLHSYDEDSISERHSSHGSLIDEVVEDQSNSNSGLHSNKTKISAHMFLLVTGAHFLTCTSQTGLLCMLPVWFTTR